MKKNQISSSTVSRNSSRLEQANATQQ